MHTFREIQNFYPTEFVFFKFSHTVIIYLFKIRKTNYNVALHM